MGISGMKGKKHSAKSKKLMGLKGNLNVSKRKDVREKISKALKGRTVPWLVGKKRLKHSKWMKKNWRKMADLDSR